VLRHPDVADKLATGLTVLLLERQSLVIDEPARARELAHLARLLASGHEFEFEGLESLHDSIMVFGTSLVNSPERRIQPHDPKEELSVHPAQTMGRRALVAVLFRR
jgi:hypothetical protein